MKLRGVEYGPIWAASGALGFFGEGYWFHNLVPGLKGALQELTFTGKTVTVNSNKGNMILDSATWQPYVRFPDCIKVDFLKGIAINAVGLSNFGIEAALATGRWQFRAKPFLLSFMPLSKTKEGRLEETRRYVEYMLVALPKFRGRVALQVNLSCPNTGENLHELEAEAVEILKILGRLGIALLPKFNVLTSPETVGRIAGEVEIDGVCISNTIPYGQLRRQINWAEMFGELSPLVDLGGGGLSGAPLFELVRQWVKHAKSIGLSVPINAGGGILHAHEASLMFEAGAQSISIATVIMLRPWHVSSIIAAAYKYHFGMH